MATIPLKTITFPGLDNTYTVPQLDDTLTITGKAADAKATGDKLDELEASEATKANIDGSYDELTSGSSKQLLSTVSIEDSTPYNFRTSGGSIDIGDREVDKLIGGTVAWNQLSQQSSGIARGGTGSWSDGVYVLTPNGTETGTLRYGYQQYPLTSSNDNHVLYTSCTCKSSQADKFRLRVSYNMFWSPSVSANTWVTITGIAKVTNEQRLFTMYANDDTLYSSSDTISFKNIQCIDLTQMFGSTIADYIYSLEQAHEGDGVAFFRKLFPKPYYAYNAGQLMSVKALSHDTTGFNQWDEEVANGYFNEGEQWNANDNVVASKNAIPVIPGATYYFRNGSNTSLYITYWKEAVSSGIGHVGQCLGRSSDISNQVYTIPNDCHYIHFNCGTAYGGTYKNDICINLSWDGERDGEYEPYEKHSYALDSDLELRGIPKLDSNNELYYDGDEYESAGTVTRKYGIVDLGTLTWSNTSAYGNFQRAQASFPDAINGNPGTNKTAPILCASYTPSVKVTDNPANAQVNTIGVMYNTLFIVISESKTGTEVKSLLNGVQLVYQLKDSAIITETAEPYQNPQIVNDFGTEEYVDTRDVQIPVGHVTQYQPNLRAKLEMAPNSPDGDGDYIVRQTNGENAYVPLVIPTELPTAPAENGTYVLKVTVSDGTPTLSWVTE